MKEYFGNSSILRLRGILKYYKPKSVFLVTGKSSYEYSGAKNLIELIFGRTEFVRFSDFEVNPKLSDIEKGMQLLKESNSDLVIAVGGGSVIDVAKSINILAVNHGDPLDYIQGRRKIENKGKLLVAIPTTSGSGSQATHFAVVYTGKTKYSLAHRDFILPDYAIIDPRLTFSMPKEVVASTGMDALCQAIESYWSVKSTTESRKYAKEAILLAVKNLESSVESQNGKSKEEMAKAAHLAGKAINISQTTASHAISYPITSYFGIPHGHAVALTIPEMLVYNYNFTKEDLLDRRGAEYVKSTINDLVKLLGARSVETARFKIIKMMGNIGLKTKLSELGIDEGGIEVVIKNGFNPDRVKNNPRLLTEEALRQILNSIK
ncbi:phosphonoacetaldehyde reductase [Candidatus Woesearchaeota archaeon]|nr:phosphonoacetaldehyde reductase [Candidatus Woesearchaeota archaeon]